MQRLKQNLLYVVQQEKIGAAVPTGTDTIIQGVIGSKEEGSGNIFYVRSYKTKADAGQSSTSMSNVVKEIEKIFRRSRTIMARSVQIN